MFDAPRRPLVYPLIEAAGILATAPEDDLSCDGSSAVIFPDDPDERTFVPFWLSLNEYVVLSSALDVGSDIAYGDEALAVMYLWQRNTMCADTICEWLQNCTSEVIGRSTGVDQFQRYQAIAAAKQAQYELDWDGTPQSINPDAPATDFDNGGSADDTRALCSAVEAFVKLFAAQKVQQLVITYAGFAALISFLALLAPGLGWILGAGIAVAVGAAFLVGGVTYTAAINALNDVTAIEAVSCCLKDYLIDKAITLANWTASLDDCSFGTGTNAEIARGFVQAALADNFYTFIDTLGEARKAIADGVSVLCSCEFIDYCDDMGTGLMADTHQLSATYPYGIYDLQIGGSWVNHDGTQGAGDGCIEGAAISYGGGSFQAGAVVEFEADVTVDGTSFSYRKDAGGSGAEQRVSFLDSAGTLISYLLNNSVSTAWESHDFVPTSPVTGVRFVAFNAFGDGEMVYLDDVCVSYTPE